MTHDHPRVNILTSHKSFHPVVGMQYQKELASSRTLAKKEREKSPNKQQALGNLNKIA